MIWGSSKTGVDTAPLTSKRLGINAYRRTLGYDRAPTADARANDAADLSSDPVKPSPRALKSEVLRSLHDQSNSGMVSMKDVAYALDHILKRSVPRRT